MLFSQPQNDVFVKVFNAMLIYTIFLWLGNTKLNMQMILNYESLPTILRLILKFVKIFFLNISTQMWITKYFLRLSLDKGKRYKFKELRST